MAVFKDKTKMERGMTVKDRFGKTYGTLNVSADGRIIFDPVRITNRLVRDRLFRFIFGSEKHRDWALNLFNAVEDTDYDNPDDLIFVALDNAVYMTMKNDVSVLVGNATMAFYEQMSTENPNMSFRMLPYVTQSLLSYAVLTKQDWYSSAGIELPEPKFYNFYNGKDDVEERIELHLSALCKGRSADPPMLELTVIQYNINGNNNPELKRKCPQLMEYAWFTDEIRRNGKYMTMDAAIGKAIDDMPENFTIKEYLEAYRSQVISMCLAEYDEEEHISSEKDISFKDGKAEGITEGEVRNSVKLIQRQMKKGLSFEESCNILSLTDKEITDCKAYMEKHQKPE